MRSKKLLIEIIIPAIMIFTILFLTGYCVIYISQLIGNLIYQPTTTEASESVVIPDVEPNIEVVPVPLATNAPQSEKITPTTVKNKSVDKLQGEKIKFRVTAFCACEICCGEWANKREVDDNGEPIVLGASGKRLIPHVSCASTLPFGTEITLDGIGTLISHDRFANWIVNKYGENVIDIYMTDHEACLNFGVQYVEGVIGE